MRKRILSEHEELRRELARLEALGASAGSREGKAGTELLRQWLAALVRTLCRHIEDEQAILLPALREADEWGPYRAAELEHQHRELQGRLDAIVNACADPLLTAEQVVDRLRGFSGALHEQMAREERIYLTEELLSDCMILPGFEDG